MAITSGNICGRLNCMPHQNGGKLCDRTSIYLINSIPHQTRGENSGQNSFLGNTVPRNQRRFPDEDNDEDDDNEAGFDD